MKVILINPPSPFLDSQDALPPLGLFYIAASLENHADVSFVDVGFGDTIPEDADVYAFTCNITQSDWCKENIPYYKGIGRTITISGEVCEYVPPEYGIKQTIIGGAYPSITYDNCNADQVVIGEGEEAILQAIKYPQKTMFYGSNLNINDIPYPARKICKADRYKYLINGKPSTPIITSRGCPYNCAFCSKGVFDKVRLRSIPDVISEIEEIKSLGFEALRIYDDSLLCNYKRAVPLLQEIKQQNIIWKAEVNSKNISSEIAELMANAGCIEVGIGIESGSQNILDNINKQTKISQHTKAVKILKSVGIKTRAYMIIGLPGESWQTIKETKDWLYKARPDSIGIGIFCPYPGSDIYNNPDKYDIKIWPHSNKDLWFRGKKGEQQSYVSTSSMSREDIVEAKQLIEKIY